MGDHEFAVAFEERKIDAIFAAVDQCQLPGAAVGIAIDGQPVYRKGFGLASMELPLTLAPAMRMRIYSATKQFTCFAYLLLCEEGKADVDDPLGKHFPEFHPAIHPVTMRQLMNNVSGLRDAHGLHFLFSGTNWTAPSDQVIELYRTTGDFDAPPGTSWFYNNGGFVLISHAIERLSGLTLGEFMRERIFEPLEMHDTLLRRTDTDFVPHSATMHMSAPAGGFVRSYVGGDRSGTGGIVSTVNDLLRWLANMERRTLGTPKTWSIMTTPQTLANGTTTAYGCALVREMYRGVQTLHHTGMGMGANAQLLKVPAAGLDVAVMVNRQDVLARELALKILDACLPALTPFQELSKSAPLSGTFHSKKTGRVIRLYPHNGQQMAEIGGAAERAFFPDEAGVLRPPESAPLPYDYAITPVGEAQHPDTLRFSDFGELDELERVAQAATEDPVGIAGRYRSENTGFEVSISKTNMRTQGRFGSVEYGLECLAKDIWRVQAASSLAPFLKGILVFDRTGFRLWSYCTRALPFRRSD